MRQLKIVPEQLETLKEIRQILSGGPAARAVQPKLPKRRLAKPRINLKTPRFSMPHPA